MSDYKILIVDGPYLFHRSYHAPYKLTTKSGLNSKTIHSFMRTLRSLHKKYKPDTTAIAWESPGTKSWRRQIYPDYKPEKSFPTDVKEEIEDLQLFLHLLNIKQFYSPGNEADDVIAVLATKYTKKPTLIFTTDKDIMQIVNDRPIHITTKKEEFDTAAVINKYGVFPNQIPDYLALVGDTSDHIKGINKIGEKKAQKLLDEYSHIEYIPKEKFPNEYHDFLKAQINKKITALNYDANIKNLFQNGFKTHQTIGTILKKYELEKMSEEIRSYKKIGGK